MIHSIRQRLTAWLCLVVALLTGVTPANGLILCLEPDGCVSIEIATSDPMCGGCEGHEEGARPATASVRGTDDLGCACVDLPVPGSTQEHRVQPRPIEFQLGPWISSPSPVVSFSLAVSALADRAPPIEVPRPPDSVALIRTVVLLV